MNVNPQQAITALSKEARSLIGKELKVSVGEKIKQKKVKTISFNRKPVIDKEKVTIKFRARFEDRSYTDIAFVMPLSTPNTTA